ncbi:MAG TPA: hypothetical protein VID95_10850 [Candidatus Limnocylindrales bacterium]|jgi:hypothetical protein
MIRFRAVAPRAAAGFAVAALVVTGCTGGASPAASGPLVVTGTPVPVASAAATPVASDTTASDTPSESALPSAVATNIDPCQLFTSADASSWVGVKFGAGKEATSEGNIRSCTYAAPGPNLFFVAVGIAPDVDTAKAAEAAAEADLQSQANQLGTLAVEKIPNFADNTDAAILQGSMSAGGQTFGARAMYVLRGTTFFTFSDIAINNGGTPPTEQAFKDKANELLAKLP